MWLWAHHLASFKETAVINSTAAIVVISMCFIWQRLVLLLHQLHSIVLLLEKCFTPISELNRASGALDFANLAPFL